MESADQEVLRAACRWLSQGRPVALITVAATWGSSPRPPGSLLAVRDDGRTAGSVSGGCVEADLCERVAGGEFTGARPRVVTYGGPEAGARFGLPCGGTLELVLEPLADAASLEPVLAAVDNRELIRRRLSLSGGQVTWGPAARDEPGLTWDGGHLEKVFGPTWRLLLIGAVQVSRFVARMALALDYQVVVCDPRAEYADAWDLPGTTVDRRMPDDAVIDTADDPRSAVVALAHDPKLDDLGLMEALGSRAFYVGALGSQANNDRRRVRLASVGVAPGHLARLHGPVGLPIGGHTPAEIAVAVVAELTAERHGRTLGRLDAAPAVPAAMGA